MTQRVKRFAIGALGALPVIGALAGGASDQIRVADPLVLEPVAPQVVDVDLRTIPFEGWKQGDPRVVRPDSYEEPVPAGGLPTGRGPVADPLLQSNLGQGDSLSDPILNLPGIGFQGILPPDTVGDVGPDHYIQMVNASVVLVLDKSGMVVAGPFALSSLWSGTGPCTDQTAGDPIVLYDALADRWLLSELTHPVHNLCVYISQTGDPVTGGWYLYQIPMPVLPDYPKYAVWPDAYYVSTFEGTSLGAYALDRAAMLAGNPATTLRFAISSLTPVSGLNIRETRILPSDVDGPLPPPLGAPNYFFRSVEALQDVDNQVDRLEVFEFHVNWATPSSSTFTQVAALIPADFALQPCVPSILECIPQPGSTTLLASLSNRPMMHLQYRNFGSYQTMVTNQTVDVGSGRAGIRWYELRNLGVGWTIHQQGTYGPGAEYRWMGSIAMNAAGDIALGYSVSDDTSVYPGVRYTGRHASDPLGTMPQGEKTIIDGAGTQSFSPRWGDYSAMTVDPSDNSTFWYTQQYLPDSGDWETRIATFWLTPFETIFGDDFETGDPSRWSYTVP